MTLCLAGSPVDSDETTIIEQNRDLYLSILHRVRHPGGWVDAEDILNRSKDMA